ncbi:MAG: hypothetical protein HZB91_04230 [Elusimicrobia bacterium]|nr:hypothetical protein [Elusimicrobiota bacterium]
MSFAELRGQTPLAALSAGVIQGVPVSQLSTPSGEPHQAVLAESGSDGLDPRSLELGNAFTLGSDLVSIHGTFSRARVEGHWFFGKKGRQVEFEARSRGKGSLLAPIAVSIWWGGAAPKNTNDMNLWQLMRRHILGASSPGEIRTDGLGSGEHHMRFNLPEDGAYLIVLQTTDAFSESNGEYSLSVSYRDPSAYSSAPVRVRGIANIAKTGAWRDRPLSVEGAELSFGRVKAVVGGDGAFEIPAIMPNIYTVVMRHQGVTSIFEAYIAERPAEQRLDLNIRVP